MEKVQKQCALSKVTICLIHLDVCSYTTGCPQCQVPGTKTPTYHQTSNLYQRQQKDTINSQQTGMIDQVQTLNKITLFLLEASVCWGWRGRASSGFAALPYHVPAMRPCVFTLCLIFSICIMGKRSPTSQVVMGINKDTISGPKGTFNHISYKSP